jgi:hypothetical protein
MTSVLFTLNGADVMDPYNNLNNSGASNNLLGANEIAEAAVVLNAFSPRYGRMAGAQVNLVGKSGTNSFHGNATYNYNDAILNASSFFSNAAGTAKARSVANLYAGAVGGPVRKNKTFFFFDTEALRYALPSSSVVSIPSVELEQYALAHAAPSAVPVYQAAIRLWDNAAGVSRAVSVVNGTGTLQDRNNIMGCGTRTFSTEKPFVNGSSGPRFGVDTSCARAWRTTNSSVNVENLFIAKADHNLTDRQSLNFRYQYDWGLQATSTSAISHLFDSKSSQPQHQGQFTHTYVITPRLVNKLTGQAGWYSAIFGVQDFKGALAAMPVRLTLNEGGANGGGGGFVTVGAQFPTGRNGGQAQIIDDLSWVKRSHTLKAGVNLRYNRITDTALSSNSIAGTYILRDLKDFSTGIVNGAAQGSTFSQSYPILAAAHIRVYSLDWYLTDEWAVRKNLKLQYGIRFEKDKNPTCTDNCFSRMNTEFLAAGYRGGADVPYNATITTGLRAAYKNYEGVMLEPRLGVVYSPFGQGKTVIRTGAGLFSNLPPASTVSSIFNNAPNKFTPSVAFGNVGLGTDASTSQAAAVASFQAFESSFDKGFTLAQIQSALGKIGFAAPNYYVPPDNFHPPKVVEWSLEIEHPITPRDVASATYAGNHGYNLSYGNTSLNNFISAPPGRFPQGFLDLPTTAPDPRFATITQVLLRGFSNYNGLSLQWRHAAGHGFTGQVGYTWSHGLQLNSVYDPRNLDFGYSNTGIDNRHQLTADILWSMPNLPNSLADRVLGGWSIGMKLFAYSGRPFSVTNGQLGGQINANFGGPILADLKDFSALGRHCTAHAVNVPCLTQSQFAVTSTSNPTAQTDYGNIPPNSFYGPGYFDIDTLVTKTIRLRERINFQLGANAFNTLNHPNFMQPNGTATGGTLGTITGTVSPPVSIYGSGQGAIVSGRVIVVTGRFTF